MSDGKPLFSTNHKNILSGANSALSADSLKKAIKAFLDQTDADGQPISVEPSILLVPTALKFLAQELTQGPTLVMSGGAENVIRPSVNVLANEGLTIVSSPYLSNAKYAGARSRTSLRSARLLAATSLRSCAQSLRSLRGCPSIARHICRAIFGAFSQGQAHADR